MCTEVHLMRGGHHRLEGVVRGHTEAAAVAADQHGVHVEEVVACEGGHRLFESRQAPKGPVVFVDDGLGPLAQ